MTPRSSVRGRTRGDPYCPGDEQPALEAFSDGVFAIAITLLDRVVPAHTEAAVHGLGHALARGWPAYCFDQLPGLGAPVRNEGEE